MKKHIKTIVTLFVSLFFFSNSRANAAEFSSFVTFPAAFEIGDYIEFAKLNPMDAGSSGFYEVSISYTRAGIAAAGTYYVSVSRNNPNVWREAGLINSNAYMSQDRNFTIDCNPQQDNSRLRIRAINNVGNKDSDLKVNVKVRSINHDRGITALNIPGKELGTLKLLPMTEEWNLFVGSLVSDASANIAIKALVNGNVGIGTATPTEKLSVNGNIRAKEIKVEAGPWPDYVFQRDYKLRPLAELATFIEQNGHLPEVPKAAEVEKDGIAVGEMNQLLLKKVEELTLYILEQEKRIKALENK